MTTSGAPATPPTAVGCPHCGELVPGGEFCGHCGCQLADTVARRRHHAYAAAPGEHLGHLAVISTLFPHLPQRSAHTFRQALAAGMALIVGLTALRLFGAATVAAAVVLPVLYLLYLYEVEVYEHEPVPVLLVTLVAGVALGAGYVQLVDRTGSLSVSGGGQNALVAGIALPLLAQALMVAGPLLLLNRAHFDETLDGLTFGAASGLGFTAAGLLSQSWHIITAPLLADQSSTDEILRLLRSGVILALVNASATGLITASLWLRRHGRSRGWHPNPWRGFWAAAAVALLAQVGIGFAGHHLVSLLLLVTVDGLIAAALLVFLRVVLHHALLEEGAERAIGPPAPCADCHRVVPTMLFCPACGVARSASPKFGRSAGAAAGEVPA